MATEQTEQKGFDAFLQDINARIDEGVRQGASTRDFVLQSADRYAFIRLADINHPVRFLKQISGQPPVCFGTVGFQHTIVDDEEPARHYMAFVFVGYWLPTGLAIMVLWAWEILGFFRYGHWSKPDMRSGSVGIRHGRAVRKGGATVLPALIQRDLSEPN